MKVLFHRTDFFGPLRAGGSFSHVNGFLDGLIQLGHDVMLTASARAFPDRFPFELIEYSDYFINFPEIPSIHYNRVLSKSVPSIIRRFRPDFLYQRHSEYIHVLPDIAHRHGIPHILEVNNSEWWWKKNWGKTFFETVLKRTEERALWGTDAIMVVSEVLKSDLIRLFGLPEAKVHVNPNGVDINVFSDAIDRQKAWAALPQELQLRWKGKHLCGFLGTFGEWHGVEVLAKSVRHAVATNPNIHFMLIGDGKLMPKVVNIVEADRMQEHVTFLGTIPHHTVPAYLTHCDILLSPHTENTDGTVFFGSPTKLFEYMGLGKAIVASSVGQLNTILRTMENAVLVPQRDEVALAGAISDLVGNPDLCNRLGANARRDAVQHYSWASNAGRVVDVYNKLTPGARS